MRKTKKLRFVHLDLCFVSVVETDKGLDNCIGIVYYCYFCAIKQKTMTNLNYISFSKDGVEISVSLFVFKEGDTYIAYCPSLDLSGYDLTEESARADFDFMLSDYLSEQLRNGTLRADLALHGWKVGKAKGNEPDLSDMLGMNEQLRNLVTHSFKKTNVNKTCQISA